MHQFKQKAVLATLLITCTMHLQAFEVDISVNGNDIITPAIEQLKKVPIAIVNLLVKVDKLRVPCLWQLQDGKIATTYIHPGWLPLAGATGAISIACFEKAWDDYQHPKKGPYCAQCEVCGSTLAIWGSTFAIITAALLYGAAHKIV